MGCRIFQLLAVVWTLLTQFACSLINLSPTSPSLPLPLIEYMNINFSGGRKCLYKESKADCWPVVKPPGQERGWQRLRIVCRLRLSFSFSPPPLCNCLLIKIVRNIFYFYRPTASTALASAPPINRIFSPSALAVSIVFVLNNQRFHFTHRNCQSDWLTANTRNWWDSIRVWSLEKWPA